MNALSTHRHLGHQSRPKSDEAGEVQLRTPTFRRGWPSPVPNAAGIFNLPSHRCFKRCCLATPRTGDVVPPAGEGDAGQRGTAPALSRRTRPAGHPAPPSPFVITPLERRALNPPLCSGAPPDRLGPVGAAVETSGLPPRCYNFIWPARQRLCPRQGRKPERSAIFSH